MSGSEERESLTETIVVLQHPTSSDSEQSDSIAILTLGIGLLHIESWQVAILE